MFGIKKDANQLKGQTPFLYSTVRKDGKDYRVTTVRDTNGDIVYMSFSDKHSYR